MRVCITRPAWECGASHKGIVQNERIKQSTAALCGLPEDGGANRKVKIPCAHNITTIKSRFAMCVGRQTKADAAVDYHSALAARSCCYEKAA